LGRIRDILQETREYVQRFQEELPEVTAATAKLYDKVYQDGALSRQVKELIALAIAITLRCEPCIAHHINSALQAKATREQIVENPGRSHPDERRSGYCAEPQGIPGSGRACRE